MFRGKTIIYYFFFVVGRDWWGRSGNGVDENPRSKYL